MRRALSVMVLLLALAGCKTVPQRKPIDTTPDHDGEHWEGVACLRAS